MSAERPRVGFAMDLRPIIECPVGAKTTMLVRIDQVKDGLSFGSELPFGTCVAFPHEGVERVGLCTIYQVSRSDQQVEGSWILNLDPGYSPKFHYPPKVEDLGFVHDVCCGLGGFSSALEFLYTSCGIPGKVISAVDSNPLAIEAYCLNHMAPALVGDILQLDTIHHMHTLQEAEQVHPMMTGGFPCQPLSRQGSRKGQADERSKVLPGILRAAYWLQASGMILECVPEALSDAGTQRVLQEFVSLTGFAITQKVVHLHHSWPSKRTRWFALLAPTNCAVLDLPLINPLPAVKDVIPFTCWPTWDREDEAQLKWTELETQTYHDPRYGEVDRRINLEQALPTALHSWGNALYKCPCSCRDNGLHPDNLLARGLRGVEVITNVWPHHSRHIHPKELQLLLGFSPMEQVLPDCRAQLCLYGNAVSPIQALWIFGQLFDALGFLGTTFSLNGLLSRYFQVILQQRDVTWPSPLPGVGQATIVFPQNSVQVSFHTNQKIGDLIRAETSLQLGKNHLTVFCEGIELPEWAFVQERTYQVHELHAPSQVPSMPVPMFLDFLGVRSVSVVPCTFTVGMFVAWSGIHDYVDLQDENHRKLSASDPVFPWQIVVVLLSQEDLAFELSLRISGFGFPDSDSHRLQVSETWATSGLWYHIDQVVKSNLLVSWAGSGFQAITVWLPSFAAAIVEVWPGATDDQLRAWLSLPNTQIYAITFETWGWNLVRLEVTPGALTAHFFEPMCQVSAYAFRTAARAYEASGRVTLHELYHDRDESFGSLGTIDRIFALLDFDLGISHELSSLFQLSRCLPNNPFWLDFDTTVFTPASTGKQLPLPVSSAASSGLGLTAKFLLDFTRAWTSNQPFDFGLDNIQVICLGADDCTLSQVQVRSFTAKAAPLFLFVLVKKHWTFIHCDCQDDELRLVHYDGLAQTSLLQIAPVIASLKKTWKINKVQAITTWTVPQTRADSCGTIALAHFGLVTGLLTETQGKQFEQLHESLAVCGSKVSSGPIGWGVEEADVIKALEKILPSHGVPLDNVKTRAQAAIKIFGVAAVHRALQAKNVWMSLKQLGNSRPKPFMWVTADELQDHIRDRSQSKFGVDLDNKRSKRVKDTKKAFHFDQLDPASLLLPPGVFILNDGRTLQQIAITEVQKNATGVAFGSYQDVVPFLTEGKMISTEGLTILVVGNYPDSAPVGLPTHSIRVPAIYKGTNEPVLLDVVSVQLGDQAVYRQTLKNAPEVAVFPTVVFRAHVFKDLWTSSQEWSELVSHPIRSLVSTFTILRLCRDQECDQTCGLFHPAIEESGIESGLIDVWGFRWTKLDGSKATPKDADVMSVYLRVPESAFAYLHCQSGVEGTFFEPRDSSSPGTDPNYSIVWLPQATLADVVHKVKTHDQCLAPCRLGSKYGVRCLSRHQEEVHKELKPQTPYVSCTVKEVYRLEPLPVGTQRQSLAETLQACQWKAKPLQPCRGSQGKAWHVGAETAPASPFIQAAHGWISVTKVKDQTPVQKSSPLIATAKTKQHIGASTQSQPASSTSDPWVAQGDPWGGWKGTQPGQDSKSKAPAPPSQHVQMKIDDVEQRLGEQIKTTIAQEFQATGPGTRLDQVEQQIQALVSNQQKLEHHVAAGSQQIAEVKGDCQLLQQAVSQCHTTISEQGATLASVSQEVTNCAAAIGTQGQHLQKVTSEVASLQEGLTRSLESYFNKQTENIEAILASHKAKSPRLS